MNTYTLLYIKQSKTVQLKFTEFLLEFSSHLQNICHPLETWIRLHYLEWENEITIA